MSIDETRARFPVDAVKRFDRAGLVVSHSSLNGLNEGAAMMGERAVVQEALFYSFNVNRHMPMDHLHRLIDQFVDLSGVPEHLSPSTTASDISRSTPS